MLVFIFPFWTYSVHLIGKHEGKVFEERDVEFDTGEGEDVGVVEGVEIAVMKMNCGETCK